MNIWPAGICEVLLLPHDNATEGARGGIPCHGLLVLYAEKLFLSLSPLFRSPSVLLGQDRAGFLVLIGGKEWREANVVVTEKFFGPSPSPSPVSSDRLRRRCYCYSVSLTLYNSVLSLLLPGNLVFDTAPGTLVTKLGQAPRLYS